MKTEDILLVLQGKRGNATKTFATQELAKAARARASALLLNAKVRHTPRLLEQGVHINHIKNVRAYIDPADPLTVVVSTDPVPTRVGRYDRVLALAVGQTSTLVLGRTKIESVQAKLKAMAAKAERLLGTRPTWRVELDAEHSTRHPVPCNAYRITRLPDDHDPVTGEPREILTGERGDAQRKLAEEIREALNNYEAGELYNALIDGRTVPPIPYYLRSLLEEHRPDELARLEAELAEIRKGEAHV